jgi:hypothetical protein
LEFSAVAEPVVQRVLLNLAVLAFPVNAFVIELVKGVYAVLSRSVYGNGLPDLALEPISISRYALRYKGTPPNWLMVSVVTKWMVEHVRLSGYEKKESLRPLAKELFGRVRMVEFEEAHARAFRRGRGRPLGSRKK